MEDAAVADQFAIITFRNTGPIKTWTDMRAANVHNARTKPLAHAMVGAPAPEHLVGTGDLVADVKQHLRTAKIDPGRLRKNGVIAYEAILSASAEFFDAGSAEERAGRLTAWKAAQRAWALKRYGAHRVASMVLHVDEKVPHIHLVVIPFEVKTDGRRKDGEPRWSLVGRIISGPGRFDEVQDEYAAAMASFGLTRGVRGSGRKHEPVPVYLARMAAKEQAVDVAAEALDRDRATVSADRARLAVAQNALDARARRIALAEQDLAEQEDALAARQASFAQFRDELIATREKLAPIVTAAQAFVRVAAGMKPEDIVPAARPAVAAARQMIDTVRSAQQPSVPSRNPVDTSHQHAQQFASVGR
jgi:hypothetical protein